MPETGMGERLRQQEGIAKFVLYALFERIHEGGWRGILCTRGVGTANAKWRRLTTGQVYGIADAVRTCHVA
jgi:hypothetical protein